MWKLYNPHEILKKYMDKALDGDLANNKIQFFLLNKISSNNKDKLIAMIQDTLWMYFHNSFLHIRDFSVELKKKHNLRIEEKSISEVHKLLLKDYNYLDLWVREINHWLQQSSISWKKILLIENIERMTIWAINSFLKTCEEPLPWRIILATTSNKSSLLDTVLSRAITLDFEEENYTNFSSLDFDSFVFDWKDDLKNIVWMLSMWDQEFVNKTTNILKSNMEIKDRLINLPSLISQKKNFHKTYEVIKEFEKAGILNSFVDWLILIYVNNGNFEMADSWLKMKQLLNSNVSVDNLIFYGIVK